MTTHRFNTFPLSSLAAGAALLLLGSCAVGPDYTAPEGATQNEWSQRVSRELSSKQPELQTWWDHFNDPDLSKLIADARESNRDLEVARARVREARAAYGVARSFLFPSLDGAGDFTRSSPSENTTLGNLPGATGPSNQYTLGFDASWEIDVFGGTRRSVESATALVESEMENYRDTLVTLFAEVALNYIDLRTAQARYDFAVANIDAQEDSVELTRNRLDAGLASEVDVSQAESNLSISRALLPQLQQQVRQTRNRLATLTGVFPADIEKRIAAQRPIPSASRSIALGLPADLLRNRPDIRLAERNLAAQNAQIGVATADLYPRFFLPGSLSLQASDAGDLFNSASGAWSFSPQFRWALFSAGRIRSQIAIEEAVMEQSYAFYENTVLLAVEEVESSLAAVEQERLRAAALQRAVVATEKTVELTTENYKLGLVSFQSVLDAQRSLFNVQDDAEASRGQISRNIVSLYKALGGSGEHAEEPPADDSAEEGEAAQPGAN